MYVEVFREFESVGWGCGGWGFGCWCGLNRYRL